MPARGRGGSDVAETKSVNKFYVLRREVQLSSASLFRGDDGRGTHGNTPNTVLFTLTPQPPIKRSVVLLA